VSITGVASLACQRFQQGPGLSPIGGVNPLREPAIDLCQQVVNFFAPALALPQSTQAYGSAPLQQRGMLARTLSYAAAVCEEPGGEASSGTA
jgi:hypothetical protein